MKKRLMRLTATILALVLVFVGIPVTGYAQSYNSGNDPVYIPVEEMTENGVLEIYLKEDGTWKPLGEIGYSKWFSDGVLSIDDMGIDFGSVELKLVKNAPGLAHIDMIALDGKSPSVVNDDDQKLLSKLSSMDNDVAEVDGEGLTFIFELDQAPSMLTINARIEPENIAQVPFLFPQTNDLGYIHASSDFYTYSWNENLGTVSFDGKIEETRNLQPLFKEFAVPGSGHPEGFTYGWVMNDDDFLYAVVDFTPDNTVDGDKDYAAVHVRTESDVKVFKASEAETQWGESFFTYTDNVEYEHKVYKFKIPKEELNVNTNTVLDIAFSAYGTAAPDYLYDIDVAFSPVTNQFMILYMMTDSESALHLYMQFLDYSGSPIGDPVIVADPSYGSSMVALSYNETQDEFFGVYVDYVNGYKNLKGIVFDSEGNEVRSSFVISEQTEDRYYPNVEYNIDNDSFYVTWETPSNGYFVEGVEVTSTYTTDRFVIVTSASDHDATYNHATDLLEVVYEYTSLGDERIAYAEVSSGGAIEVQDIQLVEGTEMLYEPSVAYDVLQETFFTAWVDNTSGSAIYAQYDVASDAAIKISETPGGGDVAEYYYDLELATGGDSGGFLAVWQYDYNRGESADLMAAYIDSTGNLVGSAFDLNDDENHQYTPRIAYNSNNDTFLVVYDSYNMVSTIATQLLGDPANGTIGFGLSTASVNEGESVTLTLSRIDGFDGDTQVYYETVSGTAISTDFTETSGYLTFADGELTNQITIQTTEDSLEEGDETFTVTLELFSGDAVLGTSEVTVTIVDDDIIGVLDFDLAAYETQEGSSVDLTVIRSLGSDGEIGVDVATATGTAGTGDFTSKSETLTFADGETSKTVTIYTTADTTPESDETFTVTMSNPTGGASLGEIYVATVSILDDDTAGTLQLSETPPTVEEGADAVFTVYRTDGTAGTVTVDYATSTSTADSSDFTAASGTLTFAAGETEKTITVATTDDGETESTEYFTLTISNPTGEAVLGTVTTNTASIIDNDLPGTIQIATPSPSVTEGEDAVFTVSRTNGTAGTVTVDYATSADSATAGADFAATSGTLTFADGETEKTITVSTLDDSTYETTELFVLTLSNATGGATLGEYSSANGTIIDNDEYVEPVYGDISFSASTYSVTEGSDLSITVNYDGESSSFIEFMLEVEAVTASTADISIDDERFYYLEEHGYYIVNFDEGETSMTFTISTVDDSSIEGNETFNITMMDPYGAELGTVYSALVTILDNDKSSSSSKDDDDDKSSSDTDTTSDTPSGTTSGTTPDTSRVINTVTKAAEELSEEDIAEDNTAAESVAGISSEIAQLIESEEPVVGFVDVRMSEMSSELDNIEDETALVAALDSYIDTVDALGEIAGDENMDDWATAKLTDMNESVSKAIQKIDDDTKVVEVAQKLVKAMDAIQAEGKVEKTAEMKKAVETLAQGALNKLGKLKTTATVTTVGEVSEVQFDDTGLEEQVAQKVNNYNTLKQTFNDYYGAENVRDFELQVTLATEKVADKVQVKVDAKILETLDKAGVDTVGIQVGGTKLLLDKEIYEAKPSTDDVGTVTARRPEVSVDMNFSSQNFDQEDEKVKFKKGYTTDVNVTLDGEKKEVLTKPVRLSFELDEFEFWDENAGPSSLSVFRQNEESGEWEPVGGVYDPVTNTLSTRRISLSQYTVMQSQKVFSDVDESWAKNEINELLNKGIIDETASFNPEETITREEFTTWVARAYGVTNDDATAPFSDISTDSEHYSEIASAYNAGIISGTGSGFNPDGQVTKEQMAAILANAMTQYDQKVINEGLEAQLATVGDGSLVSDWAGDDMAFMIELGVLDLDEGNLNPQEAMTKEQAAAILKKIYG